MLLRVYYVAQKNVVRHSIIAALSKKDHNLGQYNISETQLARKLKVKEQVDIVFMNNCKDKNK